MCAQGPRYRLPMRVILPLFPLLLGCPADSDSKLDTDPQDSAPPVAATFEAAFTVDASGAGSDRLGNVVVASNLAAFELSGVPHQGFAYQHHDWEGTGYVLFDLITVAEDGSNLAITYLYERNGGLPYAYTESFLHPMDWESASGSVTWSDTPVTLQPEIPALTGRPTPTDLGITIEGEELWLEGTSGGVLLDGVSYELLPFASVDCTACPGGPWLELHALMVAEPGPASSRALACFLIVYLFPEDPSFAQLSYGICLPSLDTPEGDFEVSWSGSLATSRGATQAGPPPGRPPRPR